MSKEAPSFEDVNYIFTHANFVINNTETGKPVFEMKRKTPTRPDGTKECYYIYKFYEENMPDDEIKAHFHMIHREVVCPLAATMDIGMFSFDEISERCTEQVKKIYESGRELTETQIDVKIKVYDHARKEIGELTVGVSTKPVGEKENGTA